MVVQFPANANDMLLSGTLAGGEALANRALAVDVPLGKGHIVMFALRPFWRWQTQGTYFLAFNAILNWNHLDAGKPAARGRRRHRSWAVGQDRKTTRSLRERVFVFMKFRGRNAHPQQARGQTRGLSYLTSSGLTAFFDPVAAYLM